MGAEDPARVSSAGPPGLSSAQVKELDRLAAERFGIALDWLMEAAGWQLARLCDGPTAVVCGVGNNGGDGLAAARHLHRWGRLASVSCIDRARLQGATARELAALAAVGVVVADKPDFTGARAVLDAIFGTGLNRAPQGRFAEWIEAVNGSRLPVIAVDVPSGLDSDTGVAYSPCVRANTTLTFTLPKTGLLLRDGPRLAGSVTAIDIGIPTEALTAIGIEPGP